MKDGSQDAWRFGEEGERALRAGDASEEPEGDAGGLSCTPFVVVGREAARDETDEGDSQGNTSTSGHDVVFEFE